MKNITKSVRLDDYTYKLIMNFEGANFSNKLENLVKYYFFDDERKNKIKILDDMISKRIQELDELNKKIFLLNKVNVSLDDYIDLIISDEKEVLK